MVDELITRLSDEVEAAHDVLNKLEILDAPTLKARMEFAADRMLSIEQELSNYRKLIGVAS